MGTQFVTLEGAVDASLRDQINQSIGRAIGVTTGKVFYLDPLRGYDGNDGLSPTKAFKTLAAGYTALRSGWNDVLVLIGDGGTTATARLSATFTWSKSAAHLIGVSSGVNVSNRARIAPTSGVTAFASFFVVSGSGCLFDNVQWFHGFDTGTNAQICMAVSGGRNLFRNCHLAGMGDQASADHAGSRSLKITSTGENVFDHCTIGLDTVTRGAANASVEFGGTGNPRNQFRDCIFPFQCDAATPLGIIVSSAGASDRWQLFERCKFINNIKSTSTTMSALATLAASMGGLLLFKDSTLVGITEFGSDATSLAQIYVDGGTVTAATSGIAVNPS